MRILNCFLRILGVRVELLIESYELPDPTWHLFVSGTRFLQTYTDTHTLVFLTGVSFFPNVFNILSTSIIITFESIDLDLAHNLFPMIRISKHVFLLVFNSLDLSRGYEICV